MPAPTDFVQSFINTLQQAEKTRDIAALTALFSDDCKVGSIAHRKPREGREGTTKFWTDYLAEFKSIESKFVHIHASGDLAVLEWTSEGTLPNGTAIDYQGVTILEFAGGKIARFRTYYDSAAFLPDGAKLLGREVEV